VSARFRVVAARRCVAGNFCTGGFEASTTMTAVIPQLRSLNQQLVRCLARLRYLVDWHTNGTVDCANQNRPRKSLVFKDLRGRCMRRRRGGDSNPRYLAVRRFSRPVHSATLPPLRRSRGLFGADCREFSDYVNHSFLIVITPVWFVIRILESELFRRILDDDHVWESSILTRGITNRLSPPRFRWNGWSFPRDDAGGFDLSSEDFVFARQVERVELRVAEADVGHPC
jgi:hypothetical protein